MPIRTTLKLSMTVLGGPAAPGTTDDNDNETAAAALVTIIDDGNVCRDSIAPGHTTY